MSATTVKYTCYFYRLYSQLFENRQGVIDDSSAANRQGVIDDFDCIFRIPWSLHVLIIDKFKKEPHKALFFVKKTIENNWGYAVLLNFIGSDLYERHASTTRLKAYSSALRYPCLIRSSLQWTGLV